MPESLWGLRAAELGGDLYTLGGIDRDHKEVASIHRLSCSSRVCKWTTINPKLKVARYATVVIPVMNSFCTPTTPSKKFYELL